MDDGSEDAAVRKAIRAFGSEFLLCMDSPRGMPRPQPARPHTHYLLNKRETTTLRSWLQAQCRISVVSNFSWKATCQAKARSHRARKCKQPRFGSNRYGWVYDNRQPEAEMGIPVWRVEMDSGICEWSAKSAFKCTLLPGVAAVALMVVAMPAAAQPSYRSALGPVTHADPTNIPGAAVALINLGTAERRSAETDDSGNYQIVNLC